jgi:hypothetical protein
MKRPCAWHGSSAKRRRAASTFLHRFRSIRNWQDPITGSRLAWKTSYHVVEPAGCAYQFDPEALAAYFISSGQFLNPVTRRPLLSPEVRRLARAIEERRGKVLLLTWEFQEDVRRSIALERETIDVLEEHCGSIWAEMLDGAEVYGGSSSTYEYVSSMTRLMGISPTSARGAVSHHRARLDQRRCWLEPLVYDHLARSLQRVEELIPVGSSEVAGLATLVRAAL